VIREFLQQGLIDDLTLSIVPVLLGKGIPLFGSELPEQRLRLESSKAYESGLVQLRYARLDAQAQL
jgi:dihydrofolate reductase